MSRMKHPKTSSSPNTTADEDWEKSYGFYEALTEIGFIIGLAIGLVLSIGLFAFTASLSSAVLATYTLYLCSILSVVAFIFVYCFDC